ncbi:PTS sugar transporter subunit IIA [Loigolactobacillus coryniformis]|jgi:PTS system mannitol-specific IIA component|uniref:Mannitol-specific phosphotransferase enzyme IIA component n=5 Tax=Lactobacillaceae TaxID=33958 RepID=J3JBM5_9LACO|nr:PTS sugar transporter subunit IIA [Loigolactobacillus coryniformis]MDT3391106.1 PTS sugar transporter subunit IIA [Bacillota bacterium]RRG03068.1 MAG: PTS mannitol transporter subunit IIA [Lactobacillus sp.]ATO43199.1 PTS mannitol transporter subunit IIA [Loigolactobacillus coryniformis subsp. torquens DSM 20004 = KCTC 3535]ATO54933.1 PTS mannitol transporter subunit IIA [Loigolactobacillus coryniformis subsp. coryniformis KCTC 3167 = DSM 20001]EJN55859.1 PTS family fructose/mannitol porter
MKGLDEKLIRINQSVKTKEDAIRMAGQLLVDNGNVDAPYIDSMLARNRDVSVYMGNFIAIPHGTEDGKQYIKETGISVVQLPWGVDFADDPADEKLVTVVFGIAGLNGEHLQLLSQIALFCSDIHNVEKLADAQSAAEIIDLLKEVE